MSVAQANQNQSWTSVDNSSATFRKLENFYFVESCACNEKFDIDRNDGKKNIYLAVQSEDMKISIRSIDVSNPNATGDTVEVPTVALRDGTDKLTAFGSRLSDSGIMWLCIFNRNAIIGVNILTKRVDYEFNNVPCPNDLCISTVDPGLLYIAGGASVRNPVNLKNSSDDTLAVMPPVGRVYTIDVRRANTPVKIFHSKNLHSLAGIEELNGKVFISQLYEVRSIDGIKAKQGGAIRGGASLSSLPASMWHSSKSTVTWQGTEVGDGENCYLSDNMSQWDDSIIATSIYRKIGAESVAAMKESFISTVGWSVGKLLTTCANCVTGAPNALDNGELLMDFSTQDVFPNVHFMLFDSITNRKWHFNMDNEKIPNKPEGCKFDGHVTHVARHGGKVIFINFMSDYVMLMDDSAVLDVMK